MNRVPDVGIAPGQSEKQLVQPAKWHAVGHAFVAEVQRAVLWGASLHEAT
jgi:hypothetical protein